MIGKGKIGVLGGDSRLVALCGYFSSYGYECAAWGISDTESNIPLGDTVKCVDWKSALVGANAVILPLPLTPDGVRLNCGKNTDSRELEIPRVTEIIQNVEKGCTVYAGKVPHLLLRFAAEHNVKIVDYYEFEDFQIKNAVPTAEGAIALAINSLDITLNSAECAVIGYGRIGRTLAQKLRYLGSNVSCVARSRHDLAWGECDGCTPIPLPKYKDSPVKSDVIFNTIPHLIFDAEILKKLDKETIIIDLASQSGGVDAKAAECLGLNVIKALSLPGKCSPRTAGKIIFDTIRDLIETEE